MIKKAFNWKEFIKSVSSIAIPVALQNLLTTTGSMVDTMMIGRLGEINVAAVGLCAQFNSLMFSCYWGFVGGAILFYSQYWGNGDEGGLERSYGMTTLCMTVVSVIFAFLAIIFPQSVMKLYTDKANIQIIGTEYLSVVGFAYPIQVFAVGLSTIHRSTGKVKAPLFASIASVGTNIILNWVFIFGHLGFPRMGVRGAALATVCAAVVNVSVILFYDKAISFDVIFHFKGHFNWNSEFIRLYFKKCFPVMCNEILIGCANMVINVVLGRQSAEAIAAVSVLRTLEGLVIGFFSGFASASSVLVGTSVGSGDIETAYERAKRMVYLCQGAILFVVALLFIFHSPILHALSLKGESFEYGKGLLIIYGIAAVIRMGNWTQNDTFRSGGDATTGTVLEISFMYVMVLPLVVWSGLFRHAPLFVVFAFCYCDEIIRYVLMQIHMYSAKWIRPVTPEGKVALVPFMERKARK